jgi:hypothetical protein
MKANLDQEIAASGTTALERAQFAIQKKWLDQKLGHMEIIMYPGSLFYVSLDRIVRLIIGAFRLLCL